MLENVLLVLLGVWIGICLGLVIFLFRYENGKFEIDCSDADTEIYRMNIRKLDKLHKRNFILLSIDRKAILRANNIDYYEKK